MSETSISDIYERQTVSCECYAQVINLMIAQVIHVQLVQRSSILNDLQKFQDHVCCLRVHLYTDVMLYLSSRLH